MSNNKQSSVESLFYKMVQSFELFDSKQLTYQEYAKEILQHKKQAVAMHKEEIKKSYTTGFGTNLHQAEHYYNETFGGNNEQQ